MNAAAFDQLLEQSFADRDLQSRERRELAAWIEQHLLDDSARAWARSRAFALTRSVLPDDSQAALAWLEDVIRVLARPAERHDPGEKSRVHFSPGRDCVDELVRQLQNVRQACDICVFTITHDRITDAILQAHQRGVGIRVITDDEKARDLGSDIERLAAHGVDCRMDSGHAAHMHHKFAVFDRRQLVNGSFNWTRSASEQNQENLIVTSDPELVTAFAEHFEKLWTALRS